MPVAATIQQGGSAVTASPVKRPGGVTFLGILVVISGILYLISACWRWSPTPAVAVAVAPT